MTGVQTCALPICFPVTIVGVRETLQNLPEYFDPRQYCGAARVYMEEMYREKILDVLGSDNKLAQLD